MYGTVGTLSAAGGAAVRIRGLICQLTSRYSCGQTTIIITFFEIGPFIEKFTTTKIVPEIFHKFETSHRNTVVIL